MNREHLWKQKLIFFFLLNSSGIDKLWARITKLKEKTQIANIRNEKGNIALDIIKMIKIKENLHKFMLISSTI